MGFVIEHQAIGIDYLVLAWWDRENELPLRIFVRERDAQAAWRTARGGESVCVWDLEVIGAERDAYIATVLDGGDGGSYGTFAGLACRPGERPVTSGTGAGRGPQWFTPRPVRRWSRCSC